VLLWVLAEETLDTTVPGGSTLVSVTIEVMVTPLLVEYAVDSQVDVEETDNTLVVSCAEDDVEVGEELEVKKGPGVAGVDADDGDVDVDVDVDVEVGEGDEEDEEDEELDELEELEELLLLDEEELFEGELAVTAVEEVDESVEGWPWEDDEEEPEDGVVVSLPRLDMIEGNKEKKDE